MKIVFMAMVIAVIACAATTASASSPSDLSETQIAVVKQAIESILKDPTSPLFGAITASQTTSTTYVCGTINAKNSFGGYSGNEPFIGIFSGPNKFTVLQLAGANATASDVIHACSDDGIIVVP